jgi:hypothetical protein
MSDLQKALSDISNIRLHLAAGTLFRGFGPPVVAVTGLMALIVAALQRIYDPTPQVFDYVATWIAVAIVSVAMIGAEMVIRSRRQHGGLADAQLLNAVEHFLPIGAAGAVVCAVVVKFAPDAAWLLPGLWSMLLGIALFVAGRFLPRTIVIAAAWYFLAGAAVLLAASQTRTLSPWMMGLPFSIGQFLVALVLHVAMEREDEQE